MKRNIIKIINKLFDFRSTQNLKIGRCVEFRNTGQIEAVLAYIGYIDNETVKIANKSKRSYLNNSGIIKLGNSVRIHKGFGMDISGELIVGNNTYINPDAIIICRHRIQIGDNCSISWNVTIMDDDLHYISGSDKKKNDIQISNHVWIGANVSIFKGVTIGEGSVIAAGTIVTKDVPSNVLFGGNPGKIIRENVFWR